jgi:histidine triad (HIT) family protein
MCIFCKIIEKESSAYRVYEDDMTLAFLDIHPISDGHTLIIPKKHVTRLEDLSEDFNQALFKTLRKIIKPIQKAMRVPALNIVINNGREAGQIIPHVHIHVIPRKSRVKGAIKSMTNRVKSYAPDYFENIALKIVNEIKW